MMPVKVSIVLPTRNGEATLPDVLDAIERQRGEFSVETVAVDSTSSDATLDLLRDRVDRVISIPPDAFDHGLTRNLAIEQTTGELVVLLVQDAVPASSGWLAELVEPLLADDRVAGTFARQRPRADAGAITRLYLEKWVAASALPRTIAVDGPDHLAALTPHARLELCAFDNVCSCVRRSVWERHPFRSTPIAEDLEWAREVLLDGYRIAYVPGAEVIHSHDRPSRYELLRTYMLHRRLYELFQLRTIPTLSLLVRAIASSVALHRRCRSDGAAPDSLMRALALAVAWPLGQYLGALSAVRGWKPARSRMV
jgi:rhamnosyltransferase